MIKSSTKTLKISGLQDLIPQYKNFFFDMDGVIWQGSQAIKNASESINDLIKNNKEVYFLTNNSSRSRQTYLERLNQFGIQSSLERIHCSSSIAAFYLKSKHPEIKKCYVVGMQGIVDELNAQGIDTIDSNQIHVQGPQMTDDELRNAQLDPDVGAIVVGIDYNFTYRKNCYSSLYIQNGAKFIATNYDTHIMIGDKKMPAGGTIVASIEVGVGQKALVVGKPNPFIVDHICEQDKLDKEQCIMIGDNLNTDILLGVNAKISTLLVLTGNTDLQLLNQHLEDPNGIKPDYYSEFL